MQSNDAVVHVPPAEAQVSPLSFHRYASDFLQAALAFPTREMYSPAPYYLHCRALELGLTAFALAKGWLVEDVKQKLGRDLLHDLGKAKELGPDGPPIPYAAPKAA